MEDYIDKEAQKHVDKSIQDHRDKLDALNEKLKTSTDKHEQNKIKQEIRLNRLQSKFFILNMSRKENS